jgi:hypothetical protein
MPTLTFTAETMPKTTEEFKQEMRKALEKASPLDDFIQITKELGRWELQYKMSSDDFYAKFQKGEMGDKMDFMKWATDFEVYQKKKTKLDRVFILLGEYAFPVTA